MFKTEDELIEWTRQESRRLTDLYIEGKISWNGFKLAWNYVWDKARREIVG